MMWNTGCHSPAFREKATLASGTNRFSITTSLEPVPRMPERAPCLLDPHFRRLHRRAEMDHRAAAVFSLVHRARHQDVAGLRAGGEHLARGDAVAALDLLGFARAADPVGAARGQQNQPFRRDPLQKRLDGGDLLMAPAPGGDRDLMGVHGERQGRGAAGARQHPQHLGQLGYFGSAPAKLLRDAGLDKPSLL